MNKFFTLLLLTFCCFILQAKDYKIVLDIKATSVEQTAAKEFQYFASKLLGKDIPIVNKATKSGTFIKIGATKEAAKALNVDFSKFADDELIIKSVNNNIYLAGGQARGTLYAVYEYLERFCNVRFLTPKVNYIPSLKALPKGDFRYLPKIKVRHISMRKNTLEEKLFAARRRLNGSLNHMLPLPQELGGGEHILGCHTFQRFVPANAKGLAKNPEFYAMINGKRVYDAQLCLTNQKLRVHVVNYIKNWLKDNPNATRVSVSMNDYKRFCQCPNCTNYLRCKKAVISDLLLDFVNDVASKLEKDFPKLEVVTLAYLDARKPPKVVKPRKNVGIFYCLIELDASKPLSHKSNIWMKKELAAWKKTGAKIYVWLYSINQKLPFLTQPNLEALNSDIRYLYSQNTEWVFCEFTYPEHYITDFIRLRFYVMSALQWNPEKSLDEIIADFCVPYYGKAANKIMEALKIIRQAPVENLGPFTCNFASSCIRSYTFEKYLAAWQKMQEARIVASTLKDKEIQNRVELAVIPMDMTLLHDCFDLRSNRPQALKNLNPGALFERDMKILKQNKITHYFGPKSYTLSAFYDKVVRLWGHNDGQVPSEIKKVPNTIVWSVAKFHNQKRGATVKIVNDPQSYSKKVIQIIANGKRLTRFEIDNAFRGKYKIYLTMKIELYPNKAGGKILTANLWESATRWTRKAKPMDVYVKNNPKKGYEVYYVGEANFKGAYDIQMPIAVNPNIKNAFIDRIIMVPVK